jgi:LDH2 family malate/lactate/ureidoglycolate dehydrogenase
VEQLKCGASASHAKAITEMLTAAERDGCHSHGLFRLPSFLNGCTGGLLNPAAEPEVLDLLPGVVKVDGKGGFQQAAQEAGFPLLLEKAKSQGVAMMGVVNTRGMSGAMWWPAEQLALEGVVAIVCCSSLSLVGCLLLSRCRIPS